MRKKIFISIILFFIIAFFSKYIFAMTTLKGIKNIKIGETITIKKEEFNIAQSGFSSAINNNMFTINKLNKNTIKYDASIVKLVSSDENGVTIQGIKSGKTGISLKCLLSNNVEANANANVTVTGENLAGTGVGTTTDVITVLNEEYDDSGITTISQCDTVPKIVWFVKKQNGVCPSYAANYNPAYEKIKKICDDIAKDPGSEEAKAAMQQLQVTRKTINRPDDELSITKEILHDVMVDLQVWTTEKSKEEAEEEADKTIGDMVESLKLYSIKLQNGVNGSRDFTEFKDLLDDIGVYDPTDLDADTANKIEGITSTILTVITDIGIVISVIMLGFIGIKYMIGSVEEKAEYKKDMIPYLIGAMLLFGITAFVKVLMAFGNQISSNI